MKIILAGGYDTKNLGDHGSHEVFQRDLRKLDQDCEIVLLSRHPDIEFDKTYNVRSILNLDHRSKKESIGRWFNGLNPGDNTDHLRKILKELESADLLVIGNGRLFVDISLDFMRGPLPYYVLLVTLARFLGVPVMIFSMTIVPVETEIGRKLVKYILSNSDVITVREEPSREEVLKFGIPDDNIIIMPDAAFGLDYVDRRENGMQILKNEGIDFRNKKFIGVNFRYTHLETKVGKNYYRALAELCDSLHSKLGADILMISQMTYNIDNPLDDDREVYRLVYKNCINKKNIHIISGRYNVFDTLSIYQLCEMVYSMRRHGLIFAATQRVPIFSLSGEKNTSFILHDMGIEEYQIKLAHIITSKEHDKLINSFYQRDIIKEKIVMQIENYRRYTSNYAELAYNIYKNEVVYE